MKESAPPLALETALALFVWGVAVLRGNQDVDVALDLLMLLEILPLIDDRSVSRQNSSLLSLPTVSDFSILKRASPDPHARVFHIFLLFFFFNRLFRA